MLRFIEGLMYDETVPRETKAILTTNFSLNKTSVFDDRSVPHKFKSIGNIETRSPYQWEIDALQSAAFAPKTVNFHERANIENIDYRRREKTNKR